MSRQHNLFSGQEIKTEQEEDHEEYRHVLLERHASRNPDRPEQDVTELTGVQVLQRSATRISSVKKSWNMSWRRNLEKYTMSGRYGNKEGRDKGLPFIEISEPVNIINKRYEKRPEQGRHQACDEIALAEEPEHGRGDVIKERPVIHRVVGI